MLCPCCSANDFYIGFNDKDGECTTNPECKLFKKNKNKVEEKKEVKPEYTIGVDLAGKGNASETYVCTSGSFHDSRLIGSHLGGALYYNDKGEIINKNNKVYGESVLNKAFKVMKQMDFFMEGKKVGVADILDREATFKDPRTRFSLTTNPFKKFIRHVYLRAKNLRSTFDILRYQDSFTIAEITRDERLRMLNKEYISINGERKEWTRDLRRMDLPSVYYFKDLDEAYRCLTEVLKINLEDYR